jgi:hypothetical protein
MKFLGLIGWVPNFTQNKNHGICLEILAICSLQKIGMPMLTAKK